MRKPNDLFEDKLLFDEAFPILDDKEIIDLVSEDEDKPKASDFLEENDEYY